MKNYFLHALLWLIVISLSGCSNETLSPVNEFEEEPSILKNPVPLKAQLVEEGEFAGPLFDLASAPNNEVLVADVGLGISNIFGANQIVLPGVTSIAPVGTGTMWATTTGSETTANTGQALHRIWKGRTEMVANLFTFEKEFNPDAANVDSNPYAVFAKSANSAVVADAGANDLLRVDNKGNIELMAVFPPEMVSTENIKSLIGCPNPADICNLPDTMLAQAVPTSVVMGPDGYLYVGELKGFPAPTGESNIWRVSPNASGIMCGEDPDCVKAFDGGFTSIIDLAFNKDGILYVAEFDAETWFAVEVLGGGAGGTIKACNTQTMECEVIASGIPMLTSITFDKDGKLWATKDALIPNIAEVIEISQ